MRTRILAVAAMAAVLLAFGVHHADAGTARSGVCVRVLQPGDQTGGPLYCYDVPADAAGTTADVLSEVNAAATNGVVDVPVAGLAGAKVRGECADGSTIVQVNVIGEGALQDVLPEIRLDSGSQRSDDTCPG